MQEFFTIISNFGFPVAVASYLLFRFEKKLEILEHTNERLVATNQTLCEEMKGLKARFDKRLNVHIKKVEKLVKIIDNLKSKK